MKIDQNCGMGLIINRKNSDTDDQRQKIAFEEFYSGKYVIEEINVPPYCRDENYVCEEIMRITAGMKEGSDVLVESLGLITKDEIRLRILIMNLNKRKLILKSMREEYFDISLLNELELSEENKEKLLRSQLSVWKKRIDYVPYDVAVDKRMARKNHYEEYGNNDPRGIRHSLIAMKLDGRHMYFGGEMSHSQFAVWFNEYYGEEVTSRIVSRVVEDIKKNSQIILNLLEPVHQEFTETDLEQKKLLSCYEAAIMYFALCNEALPYWRLEAMIQAQAAISLRLYERIENLVFTVLVLNGTQKYPFSNQVLYELIRDSITGPASEQTLRKALTAGAYTYEERTEYFKEKASQYDSIEQLGEYLERILIWIH